MSKYRPPNKQVRGNANAHAPIKAHEGFYPTTAVAKVYLRWEPFGVAIP